MNSFEYVVYYDYRVCDPLASPKEPNEVQRALRDFPSALQLSLLRDDPTLEPPKLIDGPSITLRVTTALDEAGTDDKVRHCLKSLGLAGRRLKQD